MVRRFELLGIGPLDVVDEMSAILAAMQINRYETGLRRHETGALYHQLENFVLIAGRQLHSGDLRANAIALADIWHGFAPSAERPLVKCATPITHGQAASFGGGRKPKRAN